MMISHQLSVGFRWVFGGFSHDFQQSQSSGSSLRMIKTRLWLDANPLPGENPQTSHLSM
jgi:hypothetical protein